MTPCQNAFTMFKAIPNSQHAIKTAMGELVFAKGSGSVTINVETPDGSSQVIIHDALYVPLCTSSLVSVAQLARKGIDVKFSAERALITLGDMVCAIATWHDNLYILSTRTECGYKVGDDSLTKWHHHFGH